MSAAEKNAQINSDNNLAKEGGKCATLIKNATLVNADSTSHVDILIEDGKIAEIAPSIFRPDAEQIDAFGKYVMPGGIDAHTHFNIDVGLAQSCDDFESGTIAAACGGTTTIIDHMGFGPEGCNLHHQLARYHAFAADKAVVDYSFHGVIQHVDDSILDEMESMVLQEGISSFKLYLTYKHKLNDGEVLRVLERLGQLDALACVHPENDQAISWLQQKYISQGNTGPIYHALSRPPECEAEAIARMINLAAIAGNAPLYIVHLSNGPGLDYIRLSQQEGQPVFAETCPQYLTLDIGRYNEPEMGGLKYIMSPPLRDMDHQNSLWQGLQDGSISTVATDHCSFTFEQKLSGRNDFRMCPGGAPGVETRMPLMFSEGVMKGKLGINRFVDITSTRPAKLFGLYPRKGVVREGADADLVIFDPDRCVRITQRHLHGNSDYSPFEGMEVRGWPVLTMVRGQIVAKDGQFVGAPGYGEFLKRSGLPEEYHFFQTA